MSGGEYGGKTEDVILYCNAGEIINILDAPSKPGYRFMYWEGSKYFPGQEYKATEAHAFTAIYEKIKDSSSTNQHIVPKTGIVNK